MKTQDKMTSGFRGLVSTGMIAMLVACGGGGGSSGDDAVSSSSRPIVSRGVITQLGSIYVNGVKYETPAGGSYSSDDDDTVSGSIFRVGQVVSLRGSIDDNGVTGTADEVEYEAEVEGVASGVTVAGKTVIINQTTNTDDATLSGGALIGTRRYEVSGIWLDDSTIEATYIKDDDDGDLVDEIKGFVDAFVLGVSLTVRGVTYSYTGPTVVAVGDYVEVHFNGAVASDVQIEDDFNDLNEGLEYEIEGAVNKDVGDPATNCPATADFMIDMTCIDWNDQTQWMDGLMDENDLVSGLRVEADGHMVGGVLVAEKIKGRGNQVRITSTATGVSDPNFDLFFGAIQVTAMSGVTEFDLDNMGTSVASITGGDGLEVRGIRTGPNSMLALRIKSESVDADRHELRAVVDSIDPPLLPNGGADSSNNTITVMGVTAVAGAGTELEIEDVQIAPVPPSSVTTEAEINSFLDMIDDDDIVNLTNGPNDVVDVRIDTTNGGTNSGDGSIGSPYEAVQIEIEEEDD